MLQHEQIGGLESPRAVAEAFACEVVHRAAHLDVEFEDGVGSEVDQFGEQFVAVLPVMQAGEVRHVLEHQGRIPYGPEFAVGGETAVQSAQAERDLAADDALRSRRADEPG